jgi:coatomer subunit beta
MAKHLHMNILNSMEPFSETKFVSANLYAKSKLDDDFLINISVELKDDRLIGYTRLRSQTKGIVMNLGERIKII